MPASIRPINPPFPEPGAITALRARLQGVAAIDAVKRYAPERMKPGGSARQVLQEIRTDLVRYAGVRGRVDLGQAVTESATKGIKGLPTLDRALTLLQALPPAPPQIGDEIERWLAPRVAHALRSAGIRTLTELTLRVPRSAAWWRGVPGMGRQSAKAVEAFFAANPELTALARALIARDDAGEIRPLEFQHAREDLDGSHGRNRAPSNTCVLAADNDLAGVSSVSVQIVAV